MLEYINKLKRLNILKNEIKEREREMEALSVPILTDYSYLPILHKTFLEVTDGDDRDPETRSAFLLIMAYLYSPSVLVGFKGKKHHRMKMSSLFSFISPCVISVNTSTAIFHYIHYPEYRNMIDGIYNKMLKIFEKKHTKLFAELK